MQRPQQQTASPFWTMLPELFQVDHSGLFVDNWVIGVQDTISGILNARLNELQASPTAGNPVSMNIEVNQTENGTEHRSYKLQDGTLLLTVIFEEDNIKLEYPNNDKTCSISLMKGTVKVR